MNNEETKILNVSIEGTGGSCSQSVKSLQNGKYRIERILGQGGFGITYLATDVTLNRKVAIKEFFLKEFCLRNTMASVFVSNPTNSEFVERYLSKFLKEARTLANLRHENIIQVYEFFEENNTAYYVMEYIEGETLQEIVTRKGKLVEQEALGYMNQVAEALEYIHSLRINHLDVKPANIMVRKSDGRAVLIDFGGAKQYDTRGDQTSTTPVGISHGYAPMEQYIPGGVSTFSPQTDIYSFGATLYKLITGNTPPAASEILNSGPLLISASISLNVKDAINKSMSVRKCDRYERIADVLPKNNIHDGEPQYSVNPSNKMIQNSNEIKYQLRANAIIDAFVTKAKWGMALWAGLAFCVAIICGILDKSTGDEVYSYLGLWFLFLSMIGYFGVADYYVRKKCSEWKDMHPNDPVCKYLKAERFWKY